MLTDPTSLFAKAGERILPKWNSLVGFAKEHGIHFGRGVKFRTIPGGGIEVIGVSDPSPWIHAWKSGVPDGSGKIQLRKGTVSGKTPWTSREVQLGGKDKKGDPATIELKPKAKGVSYIAVGVNVGANDSERAELSNEPTWEELRVAEIPALPAGFGSGGVIPDREGWAWYPLVELYWKDQTVDRLFQIVVHNLNHVVVAGGSEENQERHFFPPA